MSAMKLCDGTIRLYHNELTFRKKVDIAVLLDRMKVPVIEIGEVSNAIEDRLLIQSVSASVKDSTLAVSIGLDASLAAPCMENLKAAKHARLQVVSALSTARMEYVFRKKSGEMLESAVEAVKACCAVCDDVEFCADDATRADFAYLKTVLSAVIAAGATTVTLCDTAGTALPDEFAAFCKRVREEVPETANVTLGALCQNTLGLADACAVAAMQNGVGEIKVSACHPDAVSLSGILRILNMKVGTFPMQADISTENVGQPVMVITRLCNPSAEGNTPFEDGVRALPNDIFFTEQDSQETVSGEIAKLGYTLSKDDEEKVYKAFLRIVSKKNRIDLHELEVIVASEALQVPRSFILENSIVTTGNKEDAFAHIKLSRNGQMLDGVSIGNGSVDASFLAIEKITGCHYELDDFQIQAITEGKEAMGQTLVKLRSRGKVYSGKGVSTDIVISAIKAYLNALNKIVYEEEQA